MDGRTLKGWELGMGHMKNGWDEKGKGKGREMERGVNDHVVQRQLMKGRMLCFEKSVFRTVGDGVRIPLSVFGPMT
jgi:hypothetical protein